MARSSVRHLHISCRILFAFCIKKKSHTEVLAVSRTIPKHVNTLLVLHRNMNGRAENFHRDCVGKEAGYPDIFWGNLITLVPRFSWDHIPPRFIVNCFESQLSKAVTEIEDRRRDVCWSLRIASGRWGVLQRLTMVSNILCYFKSEWTSLWSNRHGRRLVDVSFFLYYFKVDYDDDGGVDEYCEMGTNRTAKIRLEE